MTACRYCDKPMDDRSIVRTQSYWSAMADFCHRECKAAGEKQEALDCQMIDADCNNCRHYQRGKIAPKIISKLKTEDGRIVDVIFNPEYYIGGACLKFNVPTLAQPNKWTGHECFEHRTQVKL